MLIRSVLSHPTAYHYLRQIMTLGLPFKRWMPMYGLDRADARIADIGCGPADVLRYVDPKKQPGFYLGLDLSEAYLESARARAAKVGMQAEFIHIDLSRIPTDAAVRDRVKQLLQEYRIETALLLGVMHHLDDASVQRTLDLVYDAGVQTLVTSDVVLLPGLPINNFLCRWDRGQHVRTVEQYEAMLAKTAWPRFDKEFTSPGLPGYRFIHYFLRR